ncbi:MAG: ATP synthase F1 subunit delta [Muribaculaceae bacterium]|nr:ATP synthase F1 subunit delta [Muribaculaceae bacterium]
MNDGLIPRRYAKALLKVALERHEEARMYTLMNNLAESFARFADLDSTVGNPFVAPAKKLQLLMTAAGADAARDTTYADFLKLLEKNNRIAQIRAIALAYAEDYRRAEKIYKVDIASAAPLDDAGKARLEKIIGERFKDGTMEYSYTVDPALIGGFTVTVGSERLDASVKNELEQLQRKLVG